MSNSQAYASVIYRFFDRLGPLLAMFAVCAMFAALRWNTFATWENVQSILLQTAVVGVAALGGTIIIISGGIDLSVGSLVALVSVVVALVLKSLAGTDVVSGGLAPNLAALVAALVGITLAGACGLVIGSMIIGRVGKVAAIGAAGIIVSVAWSYDFNFWWCLVFGTAVAVIAWWVDNRFNASVALSPFIVTLGMWGAFRGAAKGLANNSAVYPPSSVLNQLMQLPQAKIDTSLLWQPWQWWSPGVWIFLTMAIFVAGLLRFTQFGRHVFAIGSNERTARLCGIRVEHTKLKIYSLALLFTGVAGVLQYSYVTLGDPTTASGYELKVIAAVVIGGASLSGGIGSVFGTVSGALLMTIIDNGCTKIGLEVWMQEILTGAIIVAAVALDKVRHRSAR